MDLKKIDNPKFLKELDEQQLNNLAEEIRQFILESVSKTGGHLSSNLGIVELTIALHYVFDSPKDKIFFDVGHQSYTHKILTGRAKYFDSLRKYKGLSGFQKQSESEHDVWEAGHSSTALSAAVAMAVSRDLNHENYEVIPVIGDGAIVGGESLEALNHLASTSHKVIVILNDNQMAITKSIGGFNNFLTNIRLSKTYHKMKTDYKNALSITKIGNSFYHFTKYIKDFFKHGFINDTIFEDFGLDYLGPVDGHDINDLIRVLSIAKEEKNSVVVHVVTKKGKGYRFAEHDLNGKWHGTNPFDIETGKPKTKQSTQLSWSQIVANHVEKWMGKDEDIVAITPAMIHGSCLENIFKKYPDRSFDVGIAEEHALTFTAGLSISHKKPFISVYSSFLQRAYDQIVHDIARMNLPCLCAIDRSGIVGSDGPTHHGVFDIAFLTSIPNVVVFAPKDAKELKQYINTVFHKFDAPYFVRIPRGNLDDQNLSTDDTLDVGSWVVEKNAEDYDCTIITYGENVNSVCHMIDENRLNVRVINARFIKPLDYECIKTVFVGDDLPIIVYETDLRNGSLGSMILDYCNNVHILREFEHIAIDDHFSLQGSKDDIYKEENIDLETLCNKCKELMNG